MEQNDGLTILEFQKPLEIANFVNSSSKKAVKRKINWNALLSLGVYGTGILALLIALLELLTI